MSGSRQCPYFRQSGKMSVGRGLGYCEIDCNPACCDGDVRFCENFDALKRFLVEKKKKEETLKWHHSGNCYFLRSQRIDA